VRFSSVRFFRDPQSWNRISLQTFFSTGCVFAYGCLGDLCSLDNTLFQANMTAICPEEFVFLRSNGTDGRATFLDLDIQVHSLHCAVGVYGGRDGFGFGVVGFPGLDGGILVGPSCGTCLSRLIGFAGVCGRVKDFNDRDSIISRRLLGRGFPFISLNFLCRGLGGVCRVLWRAFWFGEAIWLFLGGVD